MYAESYHALAKRLDSFPQGYPATDNGKELAILEYLFTPEEANLASQLTLEYTPLSEIAEFAGCSLSIAVDLVKSMASKGLVHIKRGDKGIEVMLYPFVVGFYENQVFCMDETFAQLFEDYFHEAFTGLLSITPQFHRVIPIHESIQTNVEILPEEDVMHLLTQKKAWGVLDCICRKQQALLGNPCEHPIHVCLGMSDVPGAFDRSEAIEALDLEGAVAVLEKAADAGLVHTISNNKRDITYVCSCCTCSCGILRGIAEAGIANVVARSSYVAEVNQEKCINCGICETVCPFHAITLMDVAEVEGSSCFGCGVCIRNCPEDAISLMKRNPENILEIPETENDWLKLRAKTRNVTSI
jgi:ferredoxin